MDLDSPYFNTVIAGTIFPILFFVLYCIRKKSSTAAKGPKPPEPAGAWPVIGHIPLVAGPTLLHKTLGKIADKCGPIFSLRVGVNTCLVVSRWELAKELFTTNDKSVSSRPPVVAIKLLGYNYAISGLGPYGDYWREMRKIVNLELLSNRRLELLKHVTIQEVEIEIQELYKKWTEKKNGGSVLVEMKQWFNNLTLNATLRMIAGKKYYLCDMGSGDDEKDMRRLQEAIEEFFHYLAMVLARDAFPFLGWMDLGGHEKEMKRVAKELDGFLGEWLEEHKRKRNVSKSRLDQDFMDVLLSVLDGNAVAGFDADTITKATCLSMILGGNGTSMVTLTWALSLLLNNPRTLKKAQDELDKCVGRERIVAESDIRNLVYLQAIVKETLRVCPPGPLSSPRQFMEDCTINGYQVKKGTWLFVNVWKIQRDSRIWQNPEEFLPERFRTTHKDVDVRGQDFGLIPFGSGRRACPGISFALQMVHLTLASFLQAFDISTPNDAPVDMTETSGATTMKTTPLEVLISPRLPLHLFQSK